MSYEQALKHSKNHRKDRFYQQCSGYAGNGEATPLTEEELQNLAIKSFKELLEKAQTISFPIYIRQSAGWFYSVVDEKNLFGEKINSYADLVQFGKDYVGYSEPSVVSPSLTDRIQKASERAALSATGSRDTMKDELLK